MKHGLCPYTVEPWQERLGALQETVEVEDGESTILDFAYGAGGGEESSALPIHELVVRAADQVDRLP